MMSTEERLVYMANQIARNFEAIGHDAAAAATADHIASFWDPRMRSKILAMAGTANSGLGPVALEAVKQLARRGPPPHQTPATEFASAYGSGHDDAG